MTGTVSTRKFREAIAEFMKDLQVFDDNILKEVPNSWERYGDLILFHNKYFISTNWFVAGEKLWPFICNLLKCERIGLKGAITNDDFRSPKVSLLYGEPGDVIFIDNGIKYSWDMERNMFCRGNACERHRIGKLNCLNEVIVDLFAGIGYFTLPYLVKANAKLVHACEWNPFAVKALRTNLKLNEVTERCIIHEGDNRKFAPKNVGNRINVGIIPNSEDYWLTACEALLSTGGIIYIHNNVTSGLSDKKNINKNNCCLNCDHLIKNVEFNNKQPCVSLISSDPLYSTNTEKCIYWKKIEWFNFSLHISHVLLNYLEQIHNFKWKVTVDEFFKIKSYAPHTDHIVYSACCYPL